MTHWPAPPCAAESEQMRDETMRVIEATRAARDAAGVRRTARCSAPVHASSSTQLSWPARRPLPAVLCVGALRDGKAGLPCVYNRCPPPAAQRLDEQLDAAALESRQLAQQLQLVQALETDATKRLQETKCAVTATRWAHAIASASDLLQTLLLTCSLAVCHLCSWARLRAMADRRLPRITNQPPAVLSMWCADRASQGPPGTLGGGARVVFVGQPGRGARRA